MNQYAWDPSQLGPSPISPDGQHVGMAQSPLTGWGDQNVGPHLPWPHDAPYNAQTVPYYPPPPQDDFFDPGYVTIDQLPGYWG